MSENILPLINNLNGPFWKAAQEQRLELPFCITTGRSFWPPSLFSPFVTGGTVAWRSVAPSGKLLARVIYRRSFLKAFESLMPYGIGLVELDTGPRLQVFIAEPDGADAPQAGQRVGLEFRKFMGEASILTAKSA